MDFNLISHLESCSTFIRDNQSQISLVYYSHIPTAIISLLIGVFVFLKNKKSLISKVLFSLAAIFSLWTLFSLITWTSINSLNIMFAWSLFGILTVLLFLLSLYFVYVFIDKKDISFIKKTILVILSLPIILLTPTRLNLGNFDITNCEAVEGKYFTKYYYFFGLLIFLWIFGLIINRLRKAEKDFKRQVLLMGFGIEFFIIAFFITGYFSSLIDNFNFEFYGLFGMTVFIGFLAYLIVKFKAFDIKLIGTQALVVAMVILIGSMFFFVQGTTAVILTAVTLFLTFISGWALIKSVKLEVLRKEELQLMSDKLSNANDQLRKLDNAKSEFISIASHQLRTPLTAIKGFVSLLLEGSYGKMDPKQEDVLNKVYLSNDRLVQLVEDLLNISRIESGRMEFKFEPYQMEDICQEVMDTFVIKAKEHGLSLDYKKPAELLPKIMVDGAKVREVISNMVDNAIKYTPKGGVTLKAEKVFGTAQSIESPEGAIRVTVSDTGIGIPETELPYLFAKFSRGKDTKRLNAGGTGLGLYVGRNMIEASGGKIWAESAGQDKGSRFIIELPIGENKAEVEKRLEKFVEKL
jgi:signal transduction histidine kinase